MRKFLAQIKTKEFTLPTDYNENLSEVFTDHAVHGSQLDLFRSQTLSLFDFETLEWSNSSLIEAFSPIKDSTFHNDDIRYLKQVYCKLLGVNNAEVIDVLVLGSLDNRTLRNAYILADWAGCSGQIQDDSSDRRVRPSKVVYFFRQQVLLRSPNTGFSEKTCKFYMASVNWYSQHPNRDEYGNHVKIWCSHF